MQYQDRCPFWPLAILSRLLILALLVSLTSCRHQSDPDARLSSQSESQAGSSPREPTSAGESNSKQEKSQRDQESGKRKNGNKTKHRPRNLEMFLPYLDGRYNINDFQKIFPPTPGDPFNAGGMFIWQTYRLDDGTSLRVGEHGEGYAGHYDAKGKLIKKYPFGRVGR